MIIYLGADHKGFKLKEYLKNSLKEKGYEIVDLGNDSYDENDDYPDFASAVAQRVSVDYEQSRGILSCGSGVGVDVVANKFKNVRSALANTSNQAFDSRNDDDTNVLSLAADYLTPEEALKTVEVWLTTPFSGETRHQARLKKISEMESKSS